MRVTLEISAYPLDGNYVKRIKSFVEALRNCSGVELVTNQLSTQVRGDHTDVLGAVSQCLEQELADAPSTVLVMKLLNRDLPITDVPVIHPE